MSEQQKSCPQSEKITPNNVKDSMSSILDKMGAGETCKQAADTYWAQYSASAEGQMNTPVADAEFSTQVSGGAGANSMEQSGCGTFIATALKIANNTRVLNCILQNAANKSNTSVNLNQSISWETKKLSPEEEASRERLVVNFQKSNPYPTMSDIIKYIEAIDKLNEKRIAWNNKNPNDKVPLLDTKNEDALLATAVNGYNEAIATINKAFDRSIVWEGVDVKQFIQADVKLITSLSSDDKMKIESILKDISKDVTETDVSQKSGANALSPNLKEVTNKEIEKNQDITGAQIANKINEISNQFNTSQNITFVSGDKINMKNVTFEQNMVVDLCTQALISSAIDAGVKTSTEILNDSEKKTKIVTESKGIDDIIKAQGEANAAAIKAAKVGSSSALNRLIGVLISWIAFGGFFLGAPAIQDWAFKKGWVNLASAAGKLKWGFLILAIVFTVAIVLAVVYYFKALDNTTKVEEKVAHEENLGRPMEVYNLYWKAYKCDKILTENDVINWGWNKMDDSGLRVAMQAEVNKLKDKDPISLMKCYTDPSTTTSTTTAPTS